MYKLELKITKLLKDEETRDPKRKIMSVSMRLDNALFGEMLRDKKGNIVDLVVTMFMEATEGGWAKKYPQDIKKKK